MTGPEPRVAMREAPAPAALGALLPAHAPDVGPFYDGLREGHLLLRRCERCERTRLPAAPVCPHCGCERSCWSSVSGGGAVRSWVRYRRSFLAEFESLVPYVVLTVELDDGGARLFGRLVGEAGEPRVGLRVEAIIERWADGGCVLAFVEAAGS